MTFEPQPDAHRIDDPALTPLLRWFANLMCLPHLCGQAKCRRAQWCRGEPRKCLMRYAPLVPEDAREGAKAMLDGQWDGLTFDEARRTYAEIDDLVAWQGLVESCAGHKRRAD
jgi:hypothetical protein